MFGERLAISVTVNDVCAQAFGDPQKGLAVAQQARHWKRTGSFAQLKGTHIRRACDSSGNDDRCLTVALTTAHAGMPMFALTGNQRQDIIAYILSLR